MMAASKKMEQNLKNQTIKYAKHFSAVLNIPCTVVDLEDGSLESSFGVGQVDICRHCPRRECSGFEQFSEGCKEAFRWDGLYIFYCHQNMVLICASVTGDDRKLAGGLVLGPVILDNKEELLEEAMDPEYIKVLMQVPEIVPNKIQGMAEILAAIAGNISHLSHGKAGQYFYRQDSLLNAMYVEQIKKSDTQDDYTYPIVMEGKLRNAIRNRDKEGSQTILNQMLAYIYTYNNNNLEDIKPRITELVVIISRAAVDAGANFKDIFMINENFQSNIEEFKDLEDLSVWISNMLQRFISLTFEFEKVKHADTVYKVIEFIKENYMRHISLEEIARYTYMSKTYLSSLFKKETGYSISEYLNNIRIDRSQSLLVESDLSIIEIARICGFEDQSYFTKVFRKVTDITPKKFRESRGSAKKDVVIRK